MEPSLPLDQLLRLLPLRLPGLGWFLGAGVSASGGIPTAGDMVWEFKREIYCTRQRRSKASCDNLSDPVLRKRIQVFLNDQPNFPVEGCDEEYSFYFEATYPHEADRRRYIDGAVRRGTPTYGHVILALLMKSSKVSAVFGTNFDPLLEDSWARVNGSISGLAVASTGEPEKAIQAISESRFPLYAKLHGDFQSRKLKNVAEELASQDARLRHALIQFVRSNGLVVCGYSGRDASIMEALDEAIDNGHGYPNGLFWTYKAGTVPSDAVIRLIDTAANAGVQAALVEIDSFDEYMASLAGMMPDAVPQASIDAAGARPVRLSAPALPSPSSRSPIVRTNALPILRLPHTCRLVKCEIGGSREVRQAISDSNADVVAARTKAGVIAFGSDAELAKAFGKDAELDLYALKAQSIAREGSQKGLLHDALARAFSASIPVDVLRRRGDLMLVLQSGGHDVALLDKLRDACGGALDGTISGLRWSEALRLRIDYQLDRFWLLLEPTVWAERTEDSRLNDIRMDFIKEREAKRYNRQWYGVFNGWTSALFGSNVKRTFRAFGIGDGMDAAFELSKISAHSGARL